MKNKWIFLILIIFLFTGCCNINNLTNDELVDNILTNNIKEQNQALEGYKIYIPNGMSLTGDYKSNNIITTYGEKYYLYVDLVSYYNKIDNEYKINTEKTPIYAKTLSYNGKKGYILVTELDEGYFVEAMYNYAKIEVITHDVKKALANSLIILNSINYNDKIIESLIGNNVLTYDEEQFKLLSPGNSTNDNFLKYEEEYGSYEDVDNELPDEDKINIKEKEQ